MRTINSENKTVLIIPDIHQNIAFAEHCLKEKFDYVVFLGDYFDCFETPDNKVYYGIDETCKWLIDKKKELGEKAIWLLGNHDLSYMSVYTHKDIPKIGTKFYLCSGFSKSKLASINKNISPDFFKDLQLCCKVDQFYLSHAGFNYAHFTPHRWPVEEHIEFLCNSWEQEKHSFRFSAFHWIGNVGVCRGGDFDTGSPIWMDFKEEFVPIEEISQIVGHTNSNKIQTKNIDGSENYCIDVYRSVYAKITNKKLEFKSWKQ